MTGPARTSRRPDDRPGPGGPLTTDVLALEAFALWLRQALDLTHTPGPTSSLADLAQGDVLRRYRLTLAFDGLTAGLADPSAEIYSCADVRALYQHYLHVLARPRTGSA